MLDAVIRRLGRLRDETHSAIAVNVGEPNSHTEVVSVMSKKQKERKKDELTEEELERQDGEPLPERTQMSVLQPLPPTVGIEPLPVPLVED
jgi:hypothetical protein